MNKYFFTILFTSIILLINIIFPEDIYCQLDKESSSSSKIDELKQISKNIANKLRQTDHNTYNGRIKENNNTMIVLLTDQGETEIAINNKTKIEWINAIGTKLTISSKDIEKDDYFAILLEKSTEKPTALSMIGKEETFSLKGIISDIDTEKESLEFVYNTNNDNRITVNLEAKAQLFIISKNNDFIEIKFSDFKKGDKIIIRGKYDNIDRRKFIVKRILLY